MWLRAVKSWLAREHPRTHAALGAVKHRLLTEARVIRHVRLRDLARGLPFMRPEWETALPVQRPTRVAVACEGGAAGLVARARAAGATVLEGGHVFYLPPSSLDAAGLGALRQAWPEGSGVKILKNPGPPSGGGYVHGPEANTIHAALLHDRPRLALVANALFAAGLGPRLVDLAELSLGGEPWTAYVVEHVDGRDPLPEECARGLAGLRALEAGGVLRVLAPGGFDHVDFTGPTCNGNALICRRTGAFRYVDFQNFRLDDYETHLGRLADAAAESTHFGDRSLLRGGRYLYQSVPGLPRAAKRRTEDRRRLLESALDEAGCSIEGRLVLDVGCNVGMMLAQYLALGAGWAVGWDRPSVVPHAERLLLALGCTRFTLVGAELAPSRALEDDVPAFLRPRIAGSLVSYLAVRGHLGWLPSLGRMPWSWMVYEGHEFDDRSAFAAHVAELGRIAPVRVAALREARDGDSDPRTFAILARA